MAVRSTVGLQRDLLRRVDAWAAGHNLPVGPGHRALAVSELLEIALAQKPVPRQVTLAPEVCQGPPCDCDSHPGLGNLFAPEGSVKP